MKAVSSRQKAIYNFICNYLHTHSIPPTEREIGQHFNIYQNAVKKHLVSLEVKGMLTLTHNGRSRGIMLNNIPKSVKLPVIETVTNFDNFFADENINGYLAVDERISGTEGAFVFVVNSNEMIALNILPQDKVIVKKMNVVRNGELVVGVYNNQILLRKYFEITGNIILEASDANMSKIVITNPNDFSLKGRVVAVFRDLSFTE